MVTVLREEQWELINSADESYLFGEGTRFRLSAGGLDFGSVDPEVQDAARPQGDGDLFGRDFLRGPELQFTFQARDGLSVWPHHDEFKQVWRADTVRSTPGAYSILRYRQAGVTYRYLGRGRKFDLVPMQNKNDQRQNITATFKLKDPERYIEPADSSTRSLTLRLVQSDPDGGIVWTPDLTWPIEFRRSSQARTGEVTVGGRRAAPFKITVYGPVSGTLSKIALSGDGWAIQTSATLQHDQKLVIDTAQNTILKNGSSVAGTLSRTSHLDARLAVGHQFVTFKATDPTNTAYAVLTWLDTVPA